MPIQYTPVTNPKDWLETMASQMGVNVINNELKLPKHIGKGFFRQYYPFEWLTVSYLKFKVHKPLEVIRTGISNNPLIPVVFYLSESQQFINNKNYHIGNHTPNGVFMPSAHISSKWIFPVNQWITNLTLTFDREWMINDEILEKNSYLHTLLTIDKSFYIFESFTVEMLSLMQEIERELSAEKTKKLHLYSILIQILEIFFIIINERENYQSKSKIHSKDIDELFKIRQILLDNICSPPQIKYLAEKAGMSVSKLQKSFKQVFGKSISQYVLFCKMQEAKRLLNTKKYTISEVGYMLGYTNLSHFSETFRKHFNTNPSVFLKSLQKKNLTEVI